MTNEIEMQDEGWRRIEPFPDNYQDGHLLYALERAKAGNNSAARRLHSCLELMSVEHLGWHLTDFARTVLADMHGDLARWFGGKTKAEELMKVLHFSSDAGTRRTFEADLRDEQIRREVLATEDEHRADGKSITRKEAFHIVSDRGETTDGYSRYQYKLSPKSISNIFYGIKPKFNYKVLGIKDTE